MLTALRRFVGSGWGPWALLGVVAVVHVVVTLVGSDPFAMVDLDVYVQGGQHLGPSLYEFVTQPLELPFTYPPFSALVFVPLGWLPWVVARVLWQLASVAALALVILFTLQLLGRAGRHATRPLPHLTGTVVTATAVSMWLEPVRTTFNYGQINLFLAAILLGGAVSARDWWAGASVGLAAGIKLVPAITGLYYLLQRRWTAAVWAVAVFVATVVLMVAIIPRETWRYFTTLIFDPGRTGPVWSVINQSLRGALARLAGHDVSTSWLVAAVLSVALGVWAAVAASRAGDRTASLLAVQFVGLLVSPISWSHHWVWVLPLLLWCLFGPHARRPAVRVLAIAWIVAVCSYLVSFLIALQWKGEPATRPGWQSWLGIVYPLLGILSLALLLAVSRTRVTRHPTAGVLPG
ncbi:mannosyltransferase [Nakamurella endophytica]|uniref:Alpha-1,2-mannosyltransferase n=1 Tax=Nakamurella endophytica TaxID=1748367 RepID=A0A917SL60_9ACTN|nr:mannosyltransferase [Nakamurella endophytica]GGL86534.1 hypothetical protein GCM10011594_02730 [Nakamurella endophytica]